MQRKLASSQKTSKYGLGRDKTSRLPCLVFSMGLSGWLRQRGSIIWVDDYQIWKKRMVWNAALQDSGRFLAPTLLFMNMGQGCRGQQLLPASVFVTAFPFALWSQLGWWKLLHFACLRFALLDPGVGTQLFWESVMWFRWSHTIFHSRTGLWLT